MAADAKVVDLTVQIGLIAPIDRIVLTGQTVQTGLIAPTGQTVPTGKLRVR